MSYASYRCTVRYGMAFGVDKFGRQGNVTIYDNALSIQDGRTVAICPDEATASKVRAALEAIDGTEWVAASNAALESKLRGQLAPSIKQEAHKP